MFGTEIPHSVRAKETSAEGRSIFAHDPGGKVAEGYANLTKESYGKKSIVKKTKKGRKSDIKHAKRDKKSNSHKSLSQKIFLTGCGTGSILLRRDIQAVSLQQ